MHIEWVWCAVNAITENGMFEMSNRIMGRQSFYQLITLDKPIFWTENETFFFVLNKKYGVRFLTTFFFYLVGMVKQFERVLMYFPRNVSACDTYVSISLINWINWFILTWKWMKKKLFIYRIITLSQNNWNAN